MADPQHFDLSRDDPGQALEASARALDAGLLVVVPTETVYGVAAREDRPEALGRLRRLKRGRKRPFSLAVDGLERLEGRLAPLPPTALRAAARWWPGPVTQVLVALDGGTLGVRVPGHAWTRELVARVGVPLLLPSANAPDQAPPVQLEDVAPAVLEQVAVVVDGGRAALGNCSTVVRPGVASLEILREGVVSREDIERHASGTVLVVCSGNTCRSPMARALLERALNRRKAADPHFAMPRVLSAGLFAEEGQRASAPAVSVLAESDLDLGSHRSRLLTSQLLEQADLVLAMTMPQLASLISLAPERQLEFQLFDPGGQEVQDPFGGSLEAYAACARSLERMAQDRADAMLSSSESNP